MTWRFWWTVFLVFCCCCYAVPGNECYLTNIALNKPATQSSVSYQGFARRGVDGNLNPDYKAESCTATHLTDNNPWWQVDLEGVFSIDHVSVQNRLNYAHRLKDFIVEIAETNAIGQNGHLKNSKLCYNYTEAHVPSAELRTLVCPTDTVGRYLRITKSSGILTLCEVIVEGKPVSCLDTTCHKMPTIRQRDDQSVTEIVQELKKLMSGTGRRSHGEFSSRVISNVALNKPTTQSSTYNASYLAVDGIVDPPTCMSTSETGYQWWQVDLGSLYTITNISIQSNADKPGGLRNVTVEVSEQSMSDVSGHLLNAILCYRPAGSHGSSDDIITLPCLHGTTGRYLRLSRIVEIMDDVLTFCEVVVEVSRNECDLTNIALNKPATQSSLYSQGFARRGVDRNLNPIYTAKSCTETSLTDNNPWWQVDLEGVYSIDHVSVQNRLKFADRLKDFIVEISETNAIGQNGHLKNSKLCYNYTEAHVPSAELRTLACPTGTVGRYLRITKSSSILTLCEVIVEGKPVSCLDTTCHKMPTIRQRNGQSVAEIVQELKKLMSGTGRRCNFQKKWIDGGWRKHVYKVMNTSDACFPSKTDQWL
ncbi:uncharacterized protein LOC117332963 [Pecten maximus]|uniref:uncharacterized protein LOC117332963 n=1 Tax=Pecten maximus TaxID=6579 RepID=UPI001457EADF|nr:uncharacterized protein LOC117332963 [Pecten maximus]